MKRALNYGDLGDFLTELRAAHPDDLPIRTMLNVWKRIVAVVPDCVSTDISDEATEKIITRFAEARGDELQPVTVNSYVNTLRRSLATMHDHFEATGSLAVAAAAPQTAPSAPTRSSTLTYGDMGEYFAAYREDYPEDRNAQRWLGTYNAVIARVPFAADTGIDPEQTEVILSLFGKIATSSKEARSAARNLDSESAQELIKMPVLKKVTATNYQFWFRNGVRHYCEFVNLPYVEVDPAERRARAAEKRRAEREAAAEREARAQQQAAVSPPSEDNAAAPIVADPVVAEPAMEQAPEADEPKTVEELNEYAFLLRPGLTVGLALPEDLTRREADRLAQWISSFVLDKG